MAPLERVLDQLTGSGSLLERLLSTVAVGVIVTDARVADDPIVYVNPSFERITGYPSEQAVGRNCRFLQGPETDPDAVAQIRRSVREGSETTIVLMNYRQDGTTFWSEIRLAPIPDADGRPLYHLGLVTDVSRHVRTEARLAHAELLHSSVFNALSGGIMIIDAHGEVVDANPAALEILGRERSQLMREDWWAQLRLRYVSGEAVVQATSPGTTAAREGRRMLDVRVLARCGDGVDRLLSINYEPLPGDSLDAPNGVVASFHDITDRQRVEEDLQLFAALVALSQDFVAIADLDGSVLYVNEAGRRLVGLESIKEARAKQIGEFLTDEARQASEQIEQTAVIEHGHWEGESSLRHFTTGRAIPVRISSYLVRHPDTGEPWALGTIQRDISDEKRVTAELMRSRSRYEAQFRSLPLPTYVWRRAGEDFVLTEWNAVAERFTQGAVSQLAGRRATDVFADAPDIIDAFEQCWSTRAAQTREVPHKMRSNGEIKHLIVTYAWVPPDLVLVHTLDITARVGTEQRLLHMTQHDDLTGLHNRRFFEGELASALGVVETAVLIVDIDHFKFVNDSLGHGPGDELLREVARTMQERLRDGDVLARFGGDEFAVLLTGADEPRARAVANHLLTAIRTQVTGVAITASAGAAAFGPATAVSASEAIVAADIALYQAKKTGRDRVSLYAGQAGQNLTWLDQIRSAIADDRLVLHGQPVIDLRPIPGPPSFELLVRMRDEQGGIVLPGSFLPTAEEFGLIREIDRWVIRRGIEFAALGNRVSINLSARSLGDPDLPAFIEERLIASGAQADHLTFEFTETAAVSSVEDARTFTDALLTLGCAAALDDFGTGFGTFVLLKHLPVSILKIDLEFVRELSTSEADQRIVRAIVQIAADAGLRTIAEGVEDAGTLALLRELGVDSAQGYHIARPGPLPG